MLCHVRVNAWRDIEIRCSHGLAGNALSIHDRLCDFHQLLGVGAVRRPLQRAVDEQGAKVVELHPEFLTG